MMMGIGYEFKILYTVVGYTLSISDNSFCVKTRPSGRENREGPVVVFESICNQLRKFSQDFIFLV